MIFYVHTSPAQHSPAHPSQSQPSPAQPNPANPSPAQSSPTQPSPAQPSPNQHKARAWTNTKSKCEGGAQCFCTTHWGDKVGEKERYLGPYHHPRATWIPWRSPWDTCISLTILKRCSALLKMYQEIIKRLSVAGSLLAVRHGERRAPMATTSHHQPPPPTTTHHHLPPPSKGYHSSAQPNTAPLWAAAPRRSSSPATRHCAA